MFRRKEGDTVPSPEGVSAEALVSRAALSSGLLLRLPELWRKSLGGQEAQQLPKDRSLGKQTET
jgi:hypothetical protein